jgi:hypothetical protein
MNKLKDHLHILVLINLVFTFFIIVFGNGGQQSEQKMVVINGQKSDFKEISLKELICKEAFNSWKDQKISESFVHPEIINKIKNGAFDTFNPNEIDNIYYKIEGRDICKTIVKLKQGFISFESVISLDGPLMYRITSLSLKKPTYTEIKEYL